MKTAFVANTAITTAARYICYMCRSDFSSSEVSGCLAVGFCRLMLFYGLSPYFMLVANTMTTLDAMTVGTTAAVSGLDTTISTMFFLMNGQKAKNSGCDWFIHFVIGHSPMNDLAIRLTLERPEGGSNGPPIGFSDLKFQAFKQSK